jgi:hypothetical protein
LDAGVSSINPGDQRAAFPNQRGPFAFMHVIAETLIGAMKETLQRDPGAKAHSYYAVASSTLHPSETEMIIEEMRGAGFVAEVTLIAHTDTSIFSIRN